MAHDISMVGNGRVITDVSKKIQENIFVTMIVSDPDYFHASFSEIYNRGPHHISGETPGGVTHRLMIPPCGVRSLQEFHETLFCIHLYRPFFLLRRAHRFRCEKSTRNIVYNEEASLLKEHTPQ